MKKISIGKEQYRDKCIFCKKQLVCKYISTPVEDDLNEVRFLDSHKSCSMNAFEIAGLTNEIREQKTKLLFLTRRLTYLKQIRYLKATEDIITL
jgi:hypothetical protein